MKNILVIDDNPLAQKMIVSALEEAGHAATAPVNFEEALKKARETIPDLVLIDAGMPDVTGFEACRKIKEMFRSPR